MNLKKLYFIFLDMVIKNTEFYAAFKSAKHSEKITADPSINKQKAKKNLDFYSFVTS